MHSVDPSEIQNFSKDSRSWWDEKGPFAPLHQLNPVRLSYLKAQICKAYSRDESDPKALKDLSVLDIGCGGGLVCEPMTRMGANVTGIDADVQAIGVAKDHAKLSGLEIDYRAESAEKLAEEKAAFDVVLALEIIEHVNDPESFVKTVCALAKPGGIVIFSTLNRTPKSYALGIVAAEYLLGLVPKGTHEWKKFVTPAELSKMLRAAGVNANDLCGLVYSPFTRDFKLSKTDLDVNYFISAGA